MANIMVIDFWSAKISEFLFTPFSQNSISIFVVLTCFCISLCVMHVLIA